MSNISNTTDLVPTIKEIEMTRFTLFLDDTAAGQFATMRDLRAAAISQKDSAAIVSYTDAAPTTVGSRARKNAGVSRTILLRNGDRAVLFCKTARGTLIVRTTDTDSAKSNGWKIERGIDGLALCAVIPDAAMTPEDFDDEKYGAFFDLAFERAVSFI